jgi:hypothetical protein
MNDADIDEWVAALRSGEYKQGSGRLKRDKFDTVPEEEFDTVPEEEFCCLGVYAEIKNLWNVETAIVPNESFLPLEVIPSTTQRVLASLNDGTDWTLVNGVEVNPTGRQHSFGEIADWIDANRESFKGVDAEAKDAEAKEDADG